MKASSVIARPAGQPHSPRVLWLALLLAVFGAMAPTVSRTLNWAHGSPGSLVEICTSAGPRWMALGLASRVNAAQEGLPSAANNASNVAPGSVPDSSPGLDHCPFCLLLADRVAPPLAALFLAMAVPGKSVASATVPIFFYPLFQMPTPPSRGPPALPNS